jgi:hypothetical protein
VDDVGFSVEWLYAFGKPTEVTPGFLAPGTHPLFPDATGIAFDKCTSS